MLARLFAEPKAPNAERLLGEIESLRVEKEALMRAVEDMGMLYHKARAELAATKHRKSGLYAFRVEEVRDMSRGIQRLEHGDWDGLRLLVSVMDDLHGDWRSF